MNLFKTIGKKYMVINIVNIILINHKMYQIKKVIECHVPNKKVIIIL
jgi:hypothetical protein